MLNGSPTEEAASRLPRVPSLEQWSAMSREARERFIIQVNELLEDPRDFMSKGRPHQTALTQAVDKLSIFFHRVQRKIYLAEELSVLYPGEEPFEPDLLAVMGLEQPPDDERMSWVVADEGRGLDLVLEIAYRGDRKKDFEKNLHRYARLGIAEYFIYDRLRFQLRAYRLPRGGGDYVPIAAPGGRYRSSVLDLELGVHQRRLRFFYGSAELPSQRELLDQLDSVAADLEAKAEETERLLQAEGERAERERDRAERERDRAERERDRAEQERDRVAQALSQQRGMLLDLAAARGLPLSEDQEARISGCEDPQRLRRWFALALTAPGGAALSLED